MATLNMYVHGDFLVMLNWTALPLWKAAPGSKWSNLRHVVWWTWDQNFEYFQYRVGWPLVNLCWQGLWDALFVFIMLLALPRIDAAADSASRWWCAKSLGVFVPLAVLAVLVGGPILLTPLTIVTALGGPQWQHAAI
jgi:hypothetical protein